MDEIRMGTEAEVAVTGYTGTGEGVVRIGGRAVFVPDALMGEVCTVRVVKAGQNVCLGEVTSRREASLHRCAPACPVYDRCGGCVLMHMDYEEELRMKRQRVEDALRRIGGCDVPVEPILGAPVWEGYRNKAIFAVGMEKGRPVTGFYEARSRKVVPAENCLIQPTEASETARAVREWMERYHIPAYDPVSRKGLVRHVFCRRAWKTDEVQAAVVTAKKELPQREELVKILRERVPGLKSVLWNYNPSSGNTVFGGEFTTLWGEDCIEDVLCSLRFRLSPQSFYQVNHDQAERLYETALSLCGLTGTETALDLCCGTGTITLLLARRAARAIGVEIVPEAVEDARENARRNGIENAEFLCADVAKAAPELLKRGVRPDVILVDPPRKGLPAAAVTAIAEMKPPRVVYVSCDPATLARDVKLLESDGYRAERAIPVDLFPRTGHVETVCLLSKLKAAHHIEVDLDMDEMDLTDAESKATYEEIKGYVKEHTGLNVSKLYIAQIKRKCGIIERENYNLPKSEDSKQPQCPPEKEKAIRDALRHFGMING